MSGTSGIRDKVRHLPGDPGCYLMKGSEGEILYVGKAKNLKNRVSSYFGLDAGLAAKTRKLVKKIDDFEVIMTKTEVEALLLERNLIKTHQPPFNILLRDDKEYPMLRVDFKEPWPRIEIVRRKKDDGATYLGPYSLASSLRTTLDAAYRIFPLIRCSPYEFKTARRPCNYYHMRLCLGPCTLPIKKEHYDSMVSDALDFIQGKSKALEDSLKSKMIDASEREDFERASQIRDQLRALEQLKEKQAVVIPQDINADSFALVQGDDLAVLHVLIVREGKLLGKEAFILEEPASTPEETLETFILQYYEKRSLPQIILIDRSFERTDPLKEALESLSGGITVEIQLPQRGVKKDLLDIAVKNARYSFDETKRLRAEKSAVLSVIQEALKLSVLPRRMECIDISHIQGTSIVGSDVCFVDGKPAKNLYRHYAIKEELGFGGDDYASIREVVRRRFERATRDDDAPDLLVIDGGSLQLSAALEASQHFPQVKTELVALAKARLDPSVESHLHYSHERIFKPELSSPIPLRPGSPEFRLLTQIRDEAHRFALSFHRLKRKKAMTASILDEVAGIGPKRRKLLLESFGSIESLANASYETLRTIPGISEEIALTLVSFFEERKLAK